MVHTEDWQGDAYTERETAGLESRSSNCIQAATTYPAAAVTPTMYVPSSTAQPGLRSALHTLPQAEGPFFWWDSPSFVTFYRNCTGSVFPQS